MIFLDTEKTVGKTGFYYVIILLLCIAFLCFAEETSNGVRKGLDCTANILIPSLFPFMALSVLMIRCGFSRVCGKLLSPFSKFLFGLNGSAAPVVFLTLIGGFPVGAKGIRTLYDQNLITASEARRMSLFCISAGPAFLITAVGVRMLNNPQTGIVLFVSQTLAVILLGVISRFLPAEKTNEKPSVKAKSEPFSDSIVHSAYDASMSMLQMTALVILFFVWLEILKKVGISNLLQIPFGTFLSHSITQNISEITFEVSSACSSLTASSASPVALAFAVGWGGLCVHFQIFGILKDLTPKKSIFFLFRFLNAVFSAVITAVLLQIFKPTQAVFSNYADTVRYDTATHIVGSFALIATCVLFVLSFKTHRKLKTTAKNIASK